MPLKKISFEYDIPEGYRFVRIGSPQLGESYIISDKKINLYSYWVIIKKIPEQEQSIDEISGKIFAEGLNAPNPNRRKHADLIHAWAEGAEIQALFAGGWSDCIKPQFEDHIKYRIKPKTKTVRFRTGITKQGDVITYQYGRSLDIEQSPNFKQWLGDWQKVEIEE